MNCICNGQMGTLYVYDRVYRVALVRYAGGKIVQETFEDVKLLAPFPYKYYQEYRFHNMGVSK